MIVRSASARAEMAKAGGNAPTTTTSSAMRPASRIALRGLNTHKAHSPQNAAIGSSCPNASSGGVALSRPLDCAGRVVRARREGGDRSV